MREELLKAVLEAMGGPAGFAKKCCEVYAQLMEEGKTATAARFLQTLTSYMTEPDVEPKEPWQR